MFSFSHPFPIIETFGPILFTIFRPAPRVCFELWRLYLFHTLANHLVHVVSVSSVVDYLSWLITNRGSITTTRILLSATGHYSPFLCFLASHLMLLAQEAHIVSLPRAWRIVLAEGSFPSCFSKYSLIILSVITLQEQRIILVPLRQKIGRVRTLPTF